MNTLNDCLDFFFPAGCALCGKGISGAPHICDKCLSGIEPVSGTCCYICGQVLKDVTPPENMVLPTCEDCRRKAPCFSRAFSAAIYNSTMKRVIYLYKYRGKDFLGHDITRIIFSVLGKIISSMEIDIVAYVPLHKKKLKKRGFNQSFILADKIGKRTGLEVPVELITRIKQTETQTHFNKVERAKNIKGSFLLKNKNLVLDKNVLLVDDVLTTGATVNECSCVLLEGGASRVYVITAARV